MRFAAVLIALVMALAPGTASAQGTATAQPTYAAPAPAGGPVAVGQAVAQKDDTEKVAIVVAPSAQPPSTIVSAGSLAATFIEWIGTILIPVLGAFLTKWLMALAKKAGVELSQAQSDKLDGMIENGLHDALAKAGVDMTGKLNVDVKNQAIAGAVQYAQLHAVDTIKALSGVDPNDPKVVAALQARAAKVLDGISPTAAPGPAAAVVVAAPPPAA